MISLLLLSVLSGHVDVLDDKLIYENPRVYVRSPECGLFVKESTYRGARLQYLDAVIGRVIPLIKFENENLNLQLAVEGGGWLVLGYHEGAFPMITQDFLAAVPLMFSTGSISGALKWNHMSSHVGDGFDLLWDKTLSPEQKQRISIVEQSQDVSIFPAIHNYSRDFVSGDLAKQDNFGSLSVKSYIQLLYVYKMIPKYLKRWAVGNGYELRYSNFYFAEDTHYYQDTDSFDVSGQTGWIISGQLAETRFCIVGYHGSDRRGQFVGRMMNEIGLGVFIR